MLKRLKHKNGKLSERGRALHSITALLAFVLLIGTLPACGKIDRQKAVDLYLTKGHFCMYYVREHAMTSQLYTENELNSDLSGAVAASILAEWGYLPEENATENLSKPVTLETVVTVCTNSLLERKPGDASNIKNREELEDAQLIADACASGLIKLEDGRFNGTKKMSFEECVELMDRAAEINASFHFGEDDAVYDFEEDVLDVEADAWETAEVFDPSV